jgi:hypothetical protein
MGVCDKVITIYEGKKTAELPITPDLSREYILACAIGKGNEETGKEAE